jgi:hypothetical protein
MLDLKIKSVVKRAKPRTLLRTTLWPRQKSDAALHAGHNFIALFAVFSDQVSQRALRITGRLSRRRTARFIDLRVSS